MLRVHEVPASTGYGEPVQKLFNFKDGERVVGAMVVSERAQKAGMLALAVTKGGFGLRFSLDPHRELSTRSGRRFAKVGEERRDRGRAGGPGQGDVLAVVTVHGRAVLCAADEVSELAGPGRGVTVIKLEKDDEVAGFGLGARNGGAILVAETEGGKKIAVGPGRRRAGEPGRQGPADRQAHAHRAGHRRGPEPDVPDQQPDGKLLN